MLRAGQLRHRIQLQAPAETRDAWGGVTTEWTDAFPQHPKGIPAKFLPAKGRTVQEGNRLIHEWPAKFIMRWMPGVVDSMRVICDGKAWQIDGIQTDETMRREIVLEVTGRGED